MLLKSEPLIIIDAQDCFVEDQHSCKNILRLVRQAIKQRRYIFLVELLQNGRSKTAIQKELRGYPKCFLVLKEDHDGSKEILQLMQHLEIASHYFAFCGYFLNCCVQKTAVGLLSGNPHECQIKIHLDACDQDAFRNLYGVYVREIGPSKTDGRHILLLKKESAPKPGWWGAASNGQKDQKAGNRTRTKVRRVSKSTT